MDARWACVHNNSNENENNINLEDCSELQVQTVPTTTYDFWP